MDRQLRKKRKVYERLKRGLYQRGWQIIRLMYFTGLTKERSVVSQAG